MRKPRISVVLAWFFCILICAASLFIAGQTLAQRLPTGQPLKLASDIVFDLLPMFFALPAALIISRQPRNTIGWLLMILPLAEVSTAPLQNYLSSFKDAPPPATFLNIAMVLITSYNWLALIMPVLMIPLFFPTGRLLSPRWRWAIYLAAGMCVFIFLWGFFSKSVQPTFASWQIDNPIGFITEQVGQFILKVWLALLVVLTVTSFVSIFVRYRRAGSVERQQMKWLFFACSLFVLIYIPGLVLQYNLLLDQVNSLFVLLFGLSMIGFPVAITIAILRYHLFDINVIIRLTLVYLVLTGLLGLVYFGGVILLQQALRVFTGLSASAAVVITTLLIAALFQPLRRRIQAIIDRRLFREKYNAEKALAQFALATRDSTDPDSLIAMLVDITQESLQPTQVSVHFIKHQYIPPQSQADSA
jgi:hypothetical protein